MAARRVAALVGRLKDDLERSRGEGRRRERLRDGIHIALLGAPNAGKSSLINRIAGREVAIVSARAGTTRDVIETHLDLNGWPVVLADTAGLREAAEDVEAEGVARALARAEVADLKVLVFDATLLPERDAATLALHDDAAVVVFNKCDVANPVDSHGAIMVSARSGAGIDALLARLEADVAERFAVTGEPALTRARHRAAVEECLVALGRFDPGGPVELACEELRSAARSVGRITGRVEVEEILDVVFREFCIGK